MCWNLSRVSTKLWTPPIYTSASQSALAEDNQMFYSAWEQQVDRRRCRHFDWWKKDVKWKIVKVRVSDDLTPNTVFQVNWVLSCARIVSSFLFLWPVVLRCVHSSCVFSWWQLLYVESLTSHHESFVLLTELMASFHPSPPPLEPVTPPNKQPAGLITAVVVWESHWGCWDSWEILLHFLLYSHRVKQQTAHTGSWQTHTESSH